MRFFIINLRKNLFTIFVIFFILSLLVFSQDNYIAAKDSLVLIYSSILPSLFPFFIASELLINSNFTYLAEKSLSKITKKFFNLPGQAIIAILLGIISGYPIGAKVVVDLKTKKLLSKSEADHLISFVNNSSPLFILSTIGLSLFHNIKVGIILLISHILSSIIIGLLFKRKHTMLSSYPQSLASQNKLVKTSEIGEILSLSIKNSISSILLVSGFVFLFSILNSIFMNLKIFDIIANLLAIINIPKDYTLSILYGLFELTNGLNFIVNLQSISLNTKILISSFILGFGGLSILFQIYSIISKENISIRHYINGKLYQAFISVVITYLLLNIPTLQFM